MNEERIKTELKNFDFEADEINDIIEQMQEETDFYLETSQGEYRFIHEDDIDNIQKEELLDDKYLLGCFTSWFIADILEISVSDVEKIQKAEGYEALGILLSKHIDEVQEKYASLDGYGHHFAHYDSGEVLLSNDFYMFRVN